MTIRASQFQIIWHLIVAFGLLGISLFSNEVGLGVLCVIISAIALFSAVSLKNRSLKLNDQLLIYTPAFGPSVTINKSDILAIDYHQVPIHHSRHFGATKSYVAIRLSENSVISREKKYQNNFQKFNYHIFFDSLAGHASDQAHTILSKWWEAKKDWKRRRRK